MRLIIGRKKDKDSVDDGDGREVGGSMFADKEQFAREFADRIVQEYGRPVAESHITEQYLVLGEMVRSYASLNWMRSKEATQSHQQKQLFYFSMEFLIGRLLTNNLMNLGVYDVVKDGLAQLGIDLNALEDVETDAGLGNGGLGRLAACFLDSLATMGLPGHGNTIRYEYGLFKQKIEDDRQVEVPDIWLANGNPWEVRKPKHAVDVNFFGKLQTEWDANGRMHVHLVDAETVRAVPYDVPVIGCASKVVNTLRLWKPEASESGPVGRDFITYIQDVNKICQNVYPDDSTDDGRMLRLKQEYFFVSAGLQSLIRAHLREYGTLDNLPDKVVIQLNDTHPILIIPELMRILLDEHMYSWDKAWYIVTHTVAYTNHTIMQEALEKWPVSMMQHLLPRIYLLVEEINRRFNAEAAARFNDPNKAYQLAIIQDGMVHMSRMADATAFSINGVAKIHTQILERDVMRSFYEMYPEKFNNKTNGVTHRRWLVYSNPQLRQLLSATIGQDYILHPEKLSALSAFVDDRDVQQSFAKVKAERKQILAAYIQRTLGIAVDTDSIFDIQAKRLHAYKRQMLNCMHIIYLYQQIKSDPGIRMYPRTFIFGAKAAPAYRYAKKVIELINRLSDVINADVDVNRYMRVVFIPNYCVSLAEIMLNAADVSEQISTAGMEASGTGNMKMMMNGAVTLGTLDGANVEIRQAVGDDNIVIFGHTVEQLAQLRAGGYSAAEVYQRDPRIRAVMDSLVDGRTWSRDKEQFKPIFDEIMGRNDEYFHLADFDQYLAAQRTVQDLYQDQPRWRRMCLANIAASGYFSTDRTIAEYNRDIWHLQKVDVR